MNESSNKLVSLQRLPSFYKIHFGEDMEFYDALEMMDHVLRKTGSIGTKFFLQKGKVGDDESGRLDLPSNVVAIEFVTLSKPLEWYSSIMQGHMNALVNYRVDPTLNQGAFNDQIEGLGELADTNQIYEIDQNVIDRARGHFIDFKNVNNECLHFKYDNIEVDVFYLGITADENGLPMVPEKTMEAIAYYYHYVQTRILFHKGFTTGDKLALAEREKERSFREALTPDWLSENEMDQILNVMTSFNRKRHNRNFRYR